MYLTEPDKIAEIDRYAAESLGIPVRELMARAGKRLAEETAKRLSGSGRILILVGPGNNGGDGYAAALELADLGYEILICDVLGVGQKSEAGKHFASLAEKRFGKPILIDQLANDDINGSSAVIDAIFGTGARFILPYEIMMLMTRIAAAPPSLLRVAADAPTGIDAGSGRANRISFRADLTVTFSFGKRGMFAYPAREYCGEIVIADIGLPCEELCRHFPPAGCLLDHDTAAALLPHRSQNSHKGSFGRLLMLAGSQKYRGAASLAASAALRAGTGVLTLASHSSVLDGALLRSPELLAMPIPDFERMDREALRLVFAAAERASAIVIGCGSGTSATLEGALWELLASEGCPILIDADALNSLALHREESLHRLKKSKREIVLTPHPLELSRLTGKPAEDIQAMRIDSARALAEATGVTVVLKGAGTVIATSGELVTLNPTGSSALAKAGSGDVLAGMIGAFLAQGLSPHDAASLGVYLHGAAGDRLAERFSEFGVLPSDLPTAAAEVLREIEQMKKSARRPSVRI